MALLLAALAVAMAVAAAPAAAVDPALWPELTGRLAALDGPAGPPPSPPAAVETPDAFTDQILGVGDPRRDAVIAVVSASGFRGAALRDHAGLAGTALAGVRVRGLVAAFGSGAAAQARVGTVVDAARGADGAGLAELVEMENAPGGRRLTTVDVFTGEARTVVGVATGPYLVVLEARVPGGVAVAADPLAEAAEAVVADLPAPSDPGAAEQLGVSPDLRTAIAAAFRRVRPSDAAAATGPVAGSILAAQHRGEVWAIASFGSRAAGDPQLFRGTLEGNVDAMGRVRLVSGCPQLPTALRAAWGLSERCDPSAPDVPLPVAPGSGALPAPARGVGHWIWELDRSGPSAEAVADRARRYGITTLYVKSGDGVNYWSQFDTAVAVFHARGLRVCGWQYVYGRRPEQEARVAARAVAAGADCFVVDAEGEYERGDRYARARRYMRTLRAAVGASYPIGLTSFAYVDLHGDFPYSAFLAPPLGAQFTMPQVYWRAFKVPVQEAMARTYTWNRIYGVAIAPIGGTYLGEPAGQITRFRCLAELGGSGGVSFWSWQHTRPFQWGALGRRLDCRSERSLARTTPRYPDLRRGSRGDAVVWLQLRLQAWGQRVAADGRLSAATMAAVQRFRRARGLAATVARLDDPTWEALLGTPPATPAPVATPPAVVTPAPATPVATPAPAP